jgi:hypothetical protein
MKTCIIISCFLFLFTPIYAQNPNALIEQKNKRYFQDEKKLTNKDLKTIFGSNPDVAEDYGKWKTNSTIAAAFYAIAGVSCMAAGATNLNSSKQQTNDLENGIIKSQSAYNSGLGFAAVGLVSVIAAIPITSSAKKHLNNMVKKHNTSISDLSKQKVEFDLLVKSNEIGLSIRF